MPELASQAQALTLVAISDSADRGSGWSFYITLADIGAAARLSVRAVRYALRELERRGYIRTEGADGRARRYRVLFGIDGKRLPEKELYSTPARHAGGKARGAPTPAPRAGGAAPRAGGAAPKDAPPNNPPIGVPVLSPDIIRKSDLKIAAPRTRKIPPAETPALDVGAEKRRQGAALEELMRKQRAETGT